MALPMNSTSRHPIQAISSDRDLGNLLQIPDKRIDVAFLPDQVEVEQLHQRTVVVTDVLRATTTMIAALANGCQKIWPQPSVEAARKCHLENPGAILGGERGGRVIEGFHQGNSPLEYSPDLISGKALILATTNGTVALERCRKAKRVLVGAMVNLSAVAEQISPDQNLTIVCSGTDGEFTSEDVLFAGALVERLVPNDHAFHLLEQQDQLSDRAFIALNHWLAIKKTIGNGNTLVDYFRVARGGVNLVKIGMVNDLVFAAEIDSHKNVPSLDLNRWEIR